MWTNPRRKQLFVFHMNWLYASIQYIGSLLDQAQCSSAVETNSGTELFFCNWSCLAMVAGLPYQGFAKLIANFIHGRPIPPLEFNASHHNLCHFPHSRVVVLITNAME
jgi:hypothetical protein